MNHMIWMITKLAAVDIVSLTVVCISEAGLKVAACPSPPYISDQIPSSFLFFPPSLCNLQPPQLLTS